MPRIVADTNIYISALNFSGMADEVLALGGVLARKFRWSATRVREARAAIGDFTVLVHPREPVSVVREDEADNRILECAPAAGADAIVTGDHHLLELRRFGGVRITTPREFLDAESRR